MGSVPKSGHLVQMASSLLNPWLYLALGYTWRRDARVVDLVAKSCPTLCDPMDCSTPGFSILHYLPGLAQTHVHWVDDAMQLSHPLSPASAPALNLFQHQGLFQKVASSHQVAKVLELELQHQS